MPVIDCDPADARERLAGAGATLTDGNTEHEVWRAERGDAVAIAYEDRVVVQGARPDDIVGLLADGPDRAHVYFDGACRGNPGPGAIGWVIAAAGGIVTEGGERIGDTTNNRAEYAALIRALEAARDRGIETVDVRGDAELIVRQVRGEYDVSDPDLRERRVRVRELLDTFDEWSIEHVPRAVNRRADDLATAALDDD